MSANKWKRSIFLFHYVQRLVSSAPPSVCYPTMQMPYLPHVQCFSIPQNKSAAALPVDFLALLAPRRTNMLRSPSMMTWIPLFALWGVLRLDGECINSWSKQMISTVDLNRWTLRIISSVDSSRWSQQQIETDNRNKSNLNTWSKRMISTADLNRWIQQLIWINSISCLGLATTDQLSRHDVIFVFEWRHHLCLVIRWACSYSVFWKQASEL